MEKSLLKLGDDATLFEPNNNLSDIFHDRFNQKIITVKNEDLLNISARGFNKDNDVQFRIQPSGKIETINFSPNMKIAALHRSENSVDFVFLEYKQKDDSYAMTNKPCKAKDSRIMSLEWISEDQVVYITTRGLELYHIYAKRKTLKFWRNCDVNIEWSLYYPLSQLLICASGITSAVMNPFVIQNNYIHKLPRFEVEFGCSNTKPKLTDKDVLIASIYERLYLLVVKCDPKGNVKQINMYELFNDVTKPVELSHVLLLNVDNPVKLHTIDNLIIVHHIMTGKSYIFDIKLQGNDEKEHLPALVTSITINGDLKARYGNGNLDLYPWFFLPPNQIVDTRLGVFSEILLQLESSWSFFDDKDKLLRFIMNRTKKEKLMLEVIKVFILDKCLSLTKLASILKEIYNPGQQQIPTLSPSKMESSKFKLIAEEYIPMTTSQKHIIDAVFSPLGDDPKMDKKWLSTALLEFLLILKQHKSTIDNYLPELLIMVMAEAHEYSRLQQIFQHKVIDDSKFLAFKLIEISKNHSPLFQIAMDILARRGNYSHIVRFLIERGQIVDAIRAIKDPVDDPTCLKLLKAAWDTDNRQTKYAVFYYLHDVLKVSCLDTPAYEVYSKEFKTLFDNEEIIEAENRFRLARISSTPVPLHSIQSDISIDRPLSESLRE